MQTTKSRRQKSALRALDFAVGVLFVLLGTAVLLLAIPRTVAAWEALGVRPAMAKLARDQTPAVDELTECVAAAEAALQWVSSATRWGNLGSCEYALARKEPPISTERAEWLARAETHTRQSLIENPADGFTWVRLAVIRRDRGASAREIVPLLMTSLDVTPNAFVLWPFRAELLLQYSAQMQLDELFTVRRQLRTIWTYAAPLRPGLVEAAYRLKRRDLLVWVLSDDREARTELQVLERRFRLP